MFRPRSEKIISGRRGISRAATSYLLTGFEDTPLVYTDSTTYRRQAVQDMAERLDAEGLLERTVPTFSQGQLRLLLLGRALLRAPTLLLLDECDEGLDERYRQIFFETLGEYASRCTVVMTAHRAANIPDWCAGRRYVRNGRLLTAPPASDAAATATYDRPTRATAHCRIRSGLQRRPRHA